METLCDFAIFAGFAIGLMGGFFVARAMYDKEL